MAISELQSYLHTTPYDNWSFDQQARQYICAFEVQGHHLGLFHFHFGRTVFPKFPKHRCSGCSHVCMRRYNGFHLDFREHLTISGFTAAILEFRMVLDMPELCHLIALTYIGKVTKGFMSIPRCSERATKRLALVGVIYPPPRFSCEG